MSDEQQKPPPGINAQTFKRLLWPGGQPAKNFTERLKIFLEIRGERTIRNLAKEIDQTEVAELRALDVVSARKPLERAHLLRVKDQLLDDVAAAKKQEKQQKQD